MKIVLEPIFEADFLSCSFGFRSKRSAHDALQSEQAGELSPDGMQRLLNFYRWDADAVRDDLRSYALTNLGDPAGVVVAD